MIKQRIPKIHPALLLGVFIVLLSIIGWTTKERLDRYKEFSSQRLIEKGVSLIRTFEAGTRTGMFTMRWGVARIQAMLYETALQPDITYLMIVDRQGKILAHSEAQKVGRIFEAIPGAASLSDDPQQVSHRVIKTEDGHAVFEIYKRFLPFQGRWVRGRMRRHMHPGGMHHPGSPAQETDKGSRPQQESIMGGIQAPDTDQFTSESYFIFVGMSMDGVLAVEKKVLRHTLFQGGVLLAVGCFGIVAVIGFQAYRQARESLDRVRAFSDQVIHNMPSGLVTLDLSGNVTAMNQAAREILGKEITRPFPEWKQMAGQLSPDSGAVSKEMKIRIGEETETYLDVTAYAVLDEKEALGSYVFLFKDLTLVRKLKNQVETNRRLAAIGKFAGGVAHEIRNPLSSIKGFATYFGSRYKDNEKDRQMAEVMVKEVGRINRSISQLLEFARPMAVDTKRVEIKPLLAHSLVLVQHDLEQKKIQADLKINTRFSSVVTDEEQLRQVLLNLYINAVQAMAAGGKLDVAVMDAPETGRLEIRVADNGCGIEPEILERIFDPYFTTRPTGTGLGLSIVHRIVENLSGTIQVQSTPGDGTVFILNLPADKEEIIS